jgi:hypothetical protein
MNDVDFYDHMRHISRDLWSCLDQSKWEEIPEVTRREMLSVMNFIQHKVRGGRSRGDGGPSYGSIEAAPPKEMIHG